MNKIMELAFIKNCKSKEHTFGLAPEYMND